MNLLRGIGSSAAALWRKSEGNSLKSVRRERAVYWLAYAFELTLYGVWQTFLPTETTLLGLPGDTAIYVAHILASLLVMLLWSERFRPLIWVSAAVMVAGFIPFLLLPEGGPRLACGMVAMAGLGGAVTCARCGFAFAANNSERMLGILLMTVAVALIYLLDALGLSGPAVTVALPLLFLAALVFCLLHFREGSLEAKEESSREDAKGLYCALAFMVVYFGIDGYLYSLRDKSYEAGFILFCVGMIAAAALFFVALVRLRLNAWHLWTFFFVLATAAALLTVFAPQLGSRLPGHLFSGLAILGWPLSLYMLACAQRRYASYRLLKRSTVIFVILSPFTTISDELVSAWAPQALPMVAMVYVLAMLFLFLLTLPYTYKHLFSVGWLTELSREDMAPEPERPPAEDPFAPYGLTPREREVASLLLAARTRRQIAGELGLTESTVKTHTSNLYKKLGINSRVELFRLFGVSPAPEGEIAE